MPSIADLSGFIAAHPSLAYAAVFLLALSEAVPVVGVVVPGSALIIGISGLVPQGLVSIWPVLAAALFGAIAGDGLAYWLGHRYGSMILSRWPLDRYPELVARSQGFIRRHGGKSVFFGRFTPAMRAFIPLLAGSLGMPVGRFYLANVLSALAWAPAHVLPGLALGASVSAAGAGAGRVALLLALVAALLWLLVQGARFILRRGVPLLSAARDDLRDRAVARNTWLGRRVRALLDPARPETPSLVFFAALVLGAAWIFFGVLEDVVAGDPLVQADRAIYNLLQGLRTPGIDAVMIAITEVGDTFVVTGVTIIVFGWLAIRRAWRAALYWTAAIGFASLINVGVKLLVLRARPAEDLYTGWSAFSFPSGHATVNAVLYGFLGFLIARELRPEWRVPTLVAGLSFAAAIAFSRVYLGAHWFSDVAGSLAFATVWTLVLGLVYVNHRPPSLNPTALAFVACAAIVLVGGFNVLRRHAADVERYAVREQMQTLTAADWLGGAWRQLPAYRIDLTGETEEPFIVQWAGDLGSLERELTSKGWRRPAPWTLTNALGWMSGTDDPLALPVFPLAAAGRFPALTLVHADEGPGTQKRDVLRLWPAETQIVSGNVKPLWMGSEVVENLSHPLGLITVSRAQPQASAPMQAFATAGSAGRIVSRETTSGGWDGRVMLTLEGPDS